METQEPLDRLTRFFASLREGEEVSFFFTKPYLNWAQALDIYAYRDLFINRENVSEVRFHVPQEYLTLEFWTDFYSHVFENYPETAQGMVEDFSNPEHYGIDASVLRGTIKGEGIARFIKRLSGEKIRGNPRYTIREKFRDLANPNGLEHRTVVHSSSPEETLRDLKICERHHLLLDLASIIESHLRSPKRKSTMVQVRFKD